jgi:LmbE family N-acetylglucosaminyl deacetylase
MWLNFQDGNVRLAPAAVHTVLGRIASYQPNIIYLPESRLGRSHYWHPDHLHTGKIVEQAAQQAGRPLTLRYYHSKTVNRLVNIDPYFEANLAALRCYASQYGINALPPFHMYALEMLRNRRVKELARKARCKYAEGFREVELQGSRAPA